MVTSAPLSGGHRSACRFLSLRDGEPCGDAGVHHVQIAPPMDLLAIVDGLGHGQPAALAAQAALRILDEQCTAPLPALLAALDHGLNGTRGAAIGLARIDGARLSYAGVGNTRALRWRGSELLRLSSQYGIVGGGLSMPVQLTEIDLHAGDWLLLFSDGLDEMLQLPLHLPEWERDPVLLCEHLLQRWRNPRDDAGIVVLHLGAL
jgi:serine phosphatase RsbU (regulator of sigma subunit)